MADIDPPSPTDIVSGRGPEGGRFVTVYTCDICKMVQFESMEEAQEHERLCAPGNNNYAPPPSHHDANPAPSSQSNQHHPPPSSTTCLPCPTTSESTTTDHNYQPNDGVVNKTLYKCRKCKLLFWTTRDAALHEQNCTDTKWHNCPVCMVLRFRTQEEVAIHERTCEGVSIIDFMFYVSITYIYILYQYLIISHMCLHNFSPPRLLYLNIGYAVESCRFTIG